MVFLEVRVNSVTNANKAAYKEIGAAASISGRIFLYTIQLQSHLIPQVGHFGYPKVDESSNGDQDLLRSSSSKNRPKTMLVVSGKAPYTVV